MRVFWPAAAAILAVACATTPVPSSHATPVPPKRIHAPEFTKAQDGSAFLVVTRDEGLRAKLCTASLFVDGREVAVLKPGEQIRLFVEEGPHLVGVTADGSICFGGGSDQISLEVTRAKPVLLRIAAGNGGGMKIEPSAF